MGFFRRNKKDKPSDLEESAVAVASKEEDEISEDKGSKRFGLGAKNTKKDKGKGKLFAGKQKDMTLVERMQLEESVAASSLDVLHELVRIGDSAIREVDDGLLIVVITNDMLVASGVDSSDEEFGSFAEALLSESIESITLADDLENGIIGIIPSSDTLITLDEFEFIHDMPLQWAIVPFDLTDDSQLILLDSTVHLDRLMEIAKSPSIELHVKGNEVIDSGDNERTWRNESSDQKDEEQDVGDYDGDDEYTRDDEDGRYDEPSSYSYADNAESVSFDPFSAENNVDFGVSNEEMDLLLSNDLNEYHDGDNVYDELDTALEDDVMYGTREEQELDVSGGYSPSSSDQETSMTAEESKSVVTKALEHSFNNSELNLSIDLSKFDDYFASFSIVRFDEKPTDDSELQRVVSNFRKDANVEIEKFHEIEISMLRNNYITNLRDIHAKLITSLDHNDNGTVYGRRFNEIDTEFDAAMSDMDRLVAAEVKSIHATYNEEREIYGENAKREAMAVYDTRYRDERNRKIEGVKDNLKSEIKSNRDVARGELYNDRRTVAGSLFDKATTHLLKSLHEEYQTIMEKELHMYDAFRKNIEMYLREHFADEVLRAKAEVERLKQNEEADTVRRQYEQMLATKTKLLEEADEQSRKALQQLEVKHQDQINELKADYEHNMNREKEDNKNLREMLQQANDSISRIGEQKDREVKHQLKVYEDQIEAQKKELAYANDRAGKGHKQKMVVYFAIGAAALAIGILFGFVYGANSTQQQMPVAPAAQVQPVGTIDRADIPSIGMEPINGSVA
ncbi:hypothetical protein [Paenibacillus glucanolyticus]|uniref:hypothetical protein n=1 Tax=Paenibacillus glucanolyticus TaxID=59843 RepID=UPI00096C83B9|nr:hypothetical protein [Paenibacillus glucanolyticus]OMF76784.1 hypothetical protein BK142_14795 [Paenibacillus glucanolyticus]